ncbi:hypothetical protein CJF31_00000687 [Rutstroemia sp. NJR-2017a BVV2]|nr:hypothetical protein CJF31_00000687 [Rutstroemia sp. NJR-2017a BVV2]
MDMFFDYI